MGLVLALVLIVVLLGGFYVHALWWAALVVFAAWSITVVARAVRRAGATRRERSRGPADGVGLPRAYLDDGRARRRRLNV